MRQPIHGGITGFGRITARGTMLALRKEPLLPDLALDRAARRARLSTRRMV